MSFRFPGWVGFLVLVSLTRENEEKKNLKMEESVKTINYYQFHRHLVKIHISTYIYISSSPYECNISVKHNNKIVIHSVSHFVQLCFITTYNLLERERERERDR